MTITLTKTPKKKLKVKTYKDSFKKIETIFYFQNIYFIGDTMNILVPLLISTIAGLSTTLGAFLIFLKIKEKNINKFIAFCLSFSIAIMIGISLTDLIPESFLTLTNENGKKGMITALTTFLLGILLIKSFIILINKQKKNTSSLYKLGILNMLALMIHNFPEGIATFLSAYQNMELGIKLGIAIMLHNIPEGIAIAIPVYYSTKNKKKALKKAFLSGLAEPLGALLAFLFLKNFVTKNFLSVILLLVAGIMITISIEEMYPEVIKYKEKRLFYLGIGIGTILVLINHFCF